MREASIRPKTNPEPEPLTQQPEGAAVFERIRNHPMTPPTALAMALAGQLSLYLPRTFENRHGEVLIDDPAAEYRLTEAELRELVKTGDLSKFEITVDNGEVRVTVPPESVGITDSDHLEAIRVPGLVTSDSFGTPMEWIGRHYEKDAKMVGGTTHADEIIAQNVAQTLQDYAALDVNPDDIVVNVTINVDGYASPEGDEKNNLVASQKRADHAGQVAASAYVAAGISPEKITVVSEGIGQEGELTDFVQALEEAGVTVTGGTPEQQVQNVLRIIRSCNNGTEDRPEVLAAFGQTIAAHRRVAFEVTTERADIVYEVPARTLGATKKLIQALEHALPVGGQTIEPVKPPVEPPLPPDKDTTEPPPPITRPESTTRPPKNIIPTGVTRHSFRRGQIRTIGTSTGHKIPRANHQRGAQQRSTGRNIQRPKRSSGRSSGRRNGSRKG